MRHGSARTYAEVTDGVKGSAAMTDIVSESTITCPTCGFQATQTMPEDGCMNRALAPSVGSRCVIGRVTTVSIAPLDPCIAAETRGV